MTRPTVKELEEELRRRYPRWADGSDPLTNDLPPLHHMKDWVIAALLIESLNSLDDLSPGDVITWDHGINAWEVVSTAGSQLKMRWVDGHIEVWRPYIRPPGLVKLPEGTPLGPIDWDQINESPKIVPRRPHPQEGYLESDKDFVLNNIDACVQFLENRLGIMND